MYKNVNTTNHYKVRTYELLTTRNIQLECNCVCTVFVHYLNVKKWSVIFILLMELSLMFYFHKSPTHTKMNPGTLTTLTYRTSAMYYLP